MGAVPQSQSLLGMTVEISNGLYITVGLFLITIVLSLPLGLLISMGGISKNPLLRKIVAFYVWVMRGTPLMLQILFWVFFPMLVLGLRWDHFPFACFAFALNYAAYFAEIFRSGIQSIDKGQYEAANALGLSHRMTMMRIIIPQTVRRVLPPISNESLNLVKDTTLVAIVSLFDILAIANRIVGRTSNLVAFAVVAVYYLVFSFIVTLIFSALEKKFMLPDQT